MFGLIATLARVAVPVVVRLATNPTTVKVAAAAGTSAAVSLGIKVAQTTGVNSASQRHAEALHRDFDLEDYMKSPAVISNIGKRVVSNASAVKDAVVSEAKDWRIMVTPVFHLATKAQYSYRMRRFDAFLQQHPDHLLLHSEDSHAAIAFGLANPEEVDICHKWHSLERKFCRSEERYLAVLRWYHPVTVTRGEKYLNDMIEVVKHHAVGNEVQVDSMEGIFVRILDDTIDSRVLDEVDIKANAHSAGYEIYTLVSAAFNHDEAELDTIREHALLPWVRRYQQVTDAQAKGLLKGWAKAHQTQKAAAPAAV